MCFRFAAPSAVAFCVLACSSNPDTAKLRHVQKADEHMANEEYKEAVLEYRNALKVDARFGEARHKLAQALDKDNRPADAAREYIRAAELLPDQPNVQLKAGTILLASGEFKRAQEAADNVLRVDPENVDAQLLIAHSYAALKDLPSAIREIEEAIQLAPEDSRPYTSLGTVHLVEGEREKAEAAYRRAVELDPKSVPARLALALFHWTGRSNLEAETELQAALALDESNPLANRTLALFYLTSGRMADAEAPLRRLAESDDTGAMLTLADHFVRADRTEEAKAMYERLLDRGGMRSVAVTRLAIIEYKSGNHAAAHALLDEELTRAPQGGDAATLKSRFLLNEGKLSEAETYATRAIEVAPRLATAHYALGLAQLAQGRTDAATTSFNETLRLNPKAGAAELQLARLNVRRGNVDEALRFAESARRSQPASMPARLEVARALLAKDDLDRAEAELKSLRSAFPKAAPVHALYGNLWLARSDVAAANRAFDLALELDPGNLQALAGRVATDVRSKRHADARARVEKAITANPKSAELFILWGRVEFSAGDYAQAERRLREAIELNPAALNAYGLLGQLYVRQERLDEARAEFEKLARLNPDSVGPKTIIGMIYEFQNRREDARRVYEEILAATNRAPVAANNLAFGYAESDENLDRALDLAQLAKQQLPNSHEVDDTLGWVHYKRNAPELAIPPLERAAKAEPGNPSYHYHLGLAYAKAGRPDDAERSLQQALKLRPDFTEASDARATLAALRR